MLEIKSCLIDTIHDRSTLVELQKYIHEVVVERGFADEKPKDIILLMVEEVGELAKALRKHVGLKIDLNKSDRYGELENEMADLFIYLLDLANACNIDLLKAFKKKERENNNRFWGSCKT